MSVIALKRPELRVYQLPRQQYLLVQQVKKRLGDMAGVELQCVLGNQIRWFHSTPSDQVAIIKQMAQELGVGLPPQA